MDRAVGHVNAVWDTATSGAAAKLRGLRDAIDAQLGASSNRRRMPSSGNEEMTRDDHNLYLAL